MIHRDRKEGGGIMLIPGDEDGQQNNGGGEKMREKGLGFRKIKTKTY